MRNRQLSAAVVACCCAGALLLTACQSNEKEKPAPTAADPVAQTSVSQREGVAGGLREDVVVVETIVRAIDTSAHRVTLEGPEGRQLTFDVNPRIKDLSKLKVGDKVTATFARRVYVDVRRDDAPPSSSYESAWGASGAGQMPGRLSAQETKLVGRVTAINTVSRTADVEFTDGVRKSIPVRSDVDLANYKVGDNVIIRVTSSLTILTKSS